MSSVQRIAWFEFFVQTPGGRHWCAHHRAGTAAKVSRPKSCIPLPLNQLLIKSRLPDVDAWLVRPAPFLTAPPGHAVVRRSGHCLPCLTGAENADLPCRVGGPGAFCRGTALFEMAAQMATKIEFLRSITRQMNAQAQLDIYRARNSAVPVAGKKSRIYVDVCLPAPKRQRYADGNRQFEC
jgi:hypothetical protein